MKKLREELNLGPMVGFYDGSDDLVHLGSRMFGGLWCDDYQFDAGRDPVYRVGDHFGDITAGETPLCPLCEKAARDE